LDNIVDTYKPTSEQHKIYPPTTQDTHWYHDTFSYPETASNDDCPNKEYKALYLFFQGLIYVKKNQHDHRAYVFYFIFS
jgi:hypothetical protein